MFSPVGSSSHTPLPLPSAPPISENEILTTFLQFIDQCVLHNRIYGLLALDIPENQEYLFLSFKEALKKVLEIYTFFDPFNYRECARRYNLIKIIGANPQPLIRLKQRKEAGESERQLFEEYEEEISPEYLKDGRVFKMTPDAARALCQIIEEDRRIDSLILSSSPVQFVIEEEKQRGAPPPFSLSLRTRFFNLAQQSFGDEVAQILAKELPKERFKLLKIQGGFTYKGAKALTDCFPSLLTPKTIHKEDVALASFRVDDAIFGLLQVQSEKYWEERRKKDPFSIESYLGV